MSYDFTSQDVLDKVREIALASPDFVYQRPEGNDICLYVHDDEPGCVVGQALHALGVPLAVLREHEGHGAGRVLMGLLNIEDPLDPAMNDVARIQRAQDSRMPWGQAVTATDEDIQRFNRDEFQKALAIL